MLERLRIPILTALVLILFLQSLFAMMIHSITWDEHASIAAGYSYVATADLRLNVEHPPLMKHLFGLPYLFLRPHVPIEDASWTDHERGVTNTQWRFAREFFSGAVDAPRLIFWSRFPVILLACLLCVLVYLWSRELYGTAAGLFAAGLCALSPSVLAHAHFATTDIGIACFFFLAVYTYWRYARRPTVAGLILAGVSCGLALSAKFSGAFLLPFYAACVVLLPLLGAETAKDTAARLAALRRIGLATVVIVAIGVFVTSLVYLQPGRIDLYFRNMIWVSFNHNPNVTYYLLGEFSQQRFPHYFVVAFLVKTSAATLALLALRLVLDPLQRSERPRNLIFLGLPVMIFFALVSWKAANIGVRYLLPVYPFLFVYIGGLFHLPAMKGKTVRAVTAALALYTVVSAVRIYPDHISYFNDLVGGPANGIRYLEASNVDWGQDLARVKPYMEANGIPRVRLLYGRVFDPGLYGIEGRWATRQEILERRPGVYVVGVKEGNRKVRLPDGSERRLLDVLGPPEARIGYSLFIYEIP